MPKAEIPLSKLVAHFELQILHQSSDYDDILLTKTNLNRPGLQLTGFYDYFSRERLQVMGMVETTYLAGLTPEARKATLARLFATRIPALVICRSEDQIEVFHECLEAAREQDTTVLRTMRDTSAFLAASISWLQVELAPRITRHGVLVEVYGEGILMLGESGVGKSEAAIELVKRGHRLIADDAVEIRRTSDTALVGTAPESIRHYIELRGLGIMDVRRLFGIGAVKPTEKINLVIQLEEWNEQKLYDRLGIDSQHIDILGIQVPCLTIPVRPGRNLAAIIEVAAMNNRQKKMGYDSALEFTKQLDQFFGG